MNAKTHLLIKFIIRVRVLQLSVGRFRHTYRFQQTERFAARRDVITDFRPRPCRSLPVQLERAAHDQDASSAHAHVVSGSIRFVQGDDRFFRERFRAGPNPQGPVKHDAGRIQLEVLIGKLKLAHDRQVLNADVLVQQNRFVGRDCHIRSGSWNRATPSQRITPFRSGNDISRGVRARIVDVRAIADIDITRAWIAGHCANRERQADGDAHALTNKPGAWFDFISTA
jgi:hypothetical protein